MSGFPSSPSTTRCPRSTSCVTSCVPRELVGRSRWLRARPTRCASCSEEHFDVVLLDIRMPGLDGLDLARVLARFSAPPAVVFVTAHEEHALEAFDVGAAGYLLKPHQRRAPRASPPAASPAIAGPGRRAQLRRGTGRVRRSDQILSRRQDIAGSSRPATTCGCTCGTARATSCGQRSRCSKSSGRPRLRPDPPELPRRAARHPRAPDRRAADDGQGRRVTNCR